MPAEPLSVMEKIEKDLFIVEYENALAQERLTLALKESKELQEKINNIRTHP
jgi:hypothetical protein